MPRPSAGLTSPARVAALAAIGALALAGACSDGQPTAIVVPDQIQSTPASALQAFTCTASIASRAVSCAPASNAASGTRGVLIGGQNSNIRLTSSNVSYTAADSLFAFDVTVQNLMNEAIGTPDGTVADPDGIQVFFSSGPTVTDGSGDITVANADGTGTFTASNQPYFAYHEILAKDAVSAVKTWQLKIPSTVNTFSFTVYVETDVQYLLVINEVMPNPAGTTIEQTGDWFELYNAGTRPVELQGLFIADSAASGRRPYHQIASSLVVQPGAYVTLGGSTNTTSNGGVTIDYSFGTALNLSNSLDAVKIARVYAGDTLTVDRTQYNSTSASDGISRELKNPALDNSNMDGSNWGPALVTAVYGTGGRGTPQAQNSIYTP